MSYGWGCLRPAPPPQVRETLDDAAAVLGFGRCLTLLVEPLAQQLAAAQAAGASGTPPGGAVGGAGAGGGFDWRTAEAALFCIK